MNTQNINYSDLSVTMIKELLRYDNKLSVNSFTQLTYNKNVRYFEYSDNDEVIIKLLDNSNMIIIIEENGSWFFLNGREWKKKNQILLSRWFIVWTSC